MKTTWFIITIIGLFSNYSYHCQLAENISKPTIEIYDLILKSLFLYGKTFGDKISRDLETVTVSPLFVVYTTLTFTVQTVVCQKIAKCKSSR
jgi:hypothetical protein